MSKSIRQILEELDTPATAKAKADLPSHPSDASVEIPEGEGSGALEVAATAKAKSDLPSHPSDASVEIPEEEDEDKDKEVAESEDEEDKEEVKESEDEDDKEVAESEDEDDAEKLKEEEDEDKEVKAEGEDMDVSGKGSEAIDGTKPQDAELKVGVEIPEEEEDDEWAEVDEEEDAEDKKAEVEVKETFKALLSGGKLSEEVQKKTALIFETALAAKAKSQAKKLRKVYESKLTKSKTAFTQTIVKNLDSYLDYVVEEWLKENKVAVEKGLHLEIAEGFLRSMKESFEKHYIDVPKEKVKLTEKLAAKVEILEGELNQALNDKVEMKKAIKKLKEDRVIAKLTEGLSATEAAKLKSLVKEVSASSADEFETKVKTLKESYFPKKSNVSSGSGVNTPIEGGIATTVNMDADVKAAADLLSRTVKK